MITKSQMNLDDVRKLESCVFFVDATSCEQYYLWQENYKKIDWKDHSMGFTYTVGYIHSNASLGVGITFRFADILGHLVCFYSSDSRYTDYFMVENFIKNNFPVYHDNGTRLSMVNAMNFHNCIIPLRDGNIK